MPDNEVPEPEDWDWFGAAVIGMFALILGPPYFAVRWVIRKLRRK